MQLWRSRHLIWMQSCGKFRAWCVGFKQDKLQGWGEERRFIQEQGLAGGDGVSTQETLVSKVGSTAIAPEGSALPLFSPLPCVGESSTLLPLRSITAIAKSNIGRWEMPGTHHTFLFFWATPAIRSYEKTHVRINSSVFKAGFKECAVKIAGHTQYRENKLLILGTGARQDTSGWTCG